MAKLYELTTAYNQLEQMLDDPSAEDGQIAAYLDECGGALREKVTNIAMLIGNIESTAEAMEKAEKRIAERRKSIENRAKSIRHYVLRNMLAANITKIECELFKISVRTNPPAVIIDDEAAIPIAYLRQPEPPAPKPDKKAILADIKQGVVIDGVRVEQGHSLIIS